MKLYLMGVLAYETAMRILREDRGRFGARFPRFFLQEFEKLSEGLVSLSSFLDKLCIEKNTKKIYSRKKFFYDGSIYFREVGEGGIFGALWRTCEDLKQIAFAQSGNVAQQAKCLNTNVGCRVRLFDIPLDQHVVEILEYVGENPYEVSSGGCLLIAAEEDAVPEEACEVGTVTNGKERVLLTGEKKRFLTPPERQAKDIENRRGQKPWGHTEEIL